MITLNLTALLLDRQQTPAPRMLATTPTAAAAAATAAAEAGAGADLVFVLVAGVLVFFMQSGFSLLEAGTVRFKNYQNVLLKNCMDACIGGLVWWAFGFAFAYGGTSDPDWNGFIGTSNFFAVGFDDTKPDSYRDWFFQFAFAATAATIVSGSLAERVNIGNYLVFSFLLTGFIYPVIVAGTWNSGGWLSAGKWNGDVGYSDFAGSGIVHLCGGVAGFVGAMIIGPRIGLYDDAAPGTNPDGGEPVYTESDPNGYENIVAKYKNKDWDILRIH